MEKILKKETINKQSKNEVKNLLNEYVVSPLNTDISDTLKKIDSTISNLKETTESKIGTVSGAVDRNTIKLKKGLEEGLEKVDDLSETIQDNHNELVNKINNLQQLKDEINTIMDTSKSKITELIEKRYKSMFVLSLLFGIVNFLGIMAIIILHFIKL